MPGVLQFVPAGARWHSKPAWLLCAARAEVFARKRWAAKKSMGHLQSDDELAATRLELSAGQGVHEICAPPPACSL